MNTKTFARIAALPLVSALLVGCGGGAMVARAPIAVAEAAPAPAVLTRSLYTKDPSGALAEGDLQRVLESPIDLQFPARVGVVPLASPFDPGGSVTVTTRSVASRDLARALIGSPHFSHVSDISTDLPNSGGIEGLRVIAARYRLRYLLLYSESVETTTHVNGWGWLYPTLIGMFVAPGVTVESQGIAQVDLLDVRTGTVLYSVVQPTRVSDQTFMVGAARKHQELQADQSAIAAKALAGHVISQTNALIGWADAVADGRGRVKTRILPAPIEVAETPRPAAFTPPVAAEVAGPR